MNVPPPIYVRGASQCSYNQVLQPDRSITYSAARVSLIEEPTLEPRLRADRSGHPGNLPGRPSGAAWRRTDIPEIDSCGLPPASSNRKPRARSVAAIAASHPLSLSFGARERRSGTDQPLRVTP